MLQGKTVQVRRGSAAVTGDKCRNKSLFNKWEDAVIWLIRKPEDLPMNMMQCKAIKENSNASLIKDEIRHPRTFPGSGIFAFRDKLRTGNRHDLIESYGRLIQKEEGEI